MPSYPEFSGRVVAVTGAAQGIGAVTARAFAGQRVCVAPLGLDEKGAKQVAGEIVSSGGRALAVQADVTAASSPAYGAAKAAVIQLTRFLASDAAAYINGVVTAETRRRPTR